MEQRFLSPIHQKVAAEFINGQLWSDFKRCLLARRPDAPDVKDETHVSAAKGHRRAGYEDAIDALEKLPFETNPQVSSPFERPALTHTAD